VDTTRLIALLNVTALVAMMLSMGMQVRIDAVVASARQTRLLSLGLLANYALMPAITVAMLRLFQADPMVSAGFLILAVCPGAPLGPPVTAVARGNVAWAIGMMLILAGLSTFLTPALLSLLLTRIARGGSALQVSALVIVRTLLITQLLPLAVGLAMRQYTRELSQKLAKPLGQFASILLVALVVLIVAAQHETLSAIRMRAWAGMTLLLFASLAIGWLCGGTVLANRKAMAATTANRNAAVGLVIANTNFAGTPAVTAVVAYGMLSILGALACAFLVGKMSNAEPNHAPATL
jgi:BASS family bile acid:Na+ symporter